MGHARHAHVWGRMRAAQGMRIEVASLRRECGPCGVWGTLAGGRPGGPGLIAVGSWGRSGAATGFTVAPSLKRAGSQDGPGCPIGLGQELPGWLISSVGLMGCGVAGGEWVWGGWRCTQEAHDIGQTLQDKLEAQVCVRERIPLHEEGTGCGARRMLCPRCALSVHQCTAVGA